MTRPTQLPIEGLPEAPESERAELVLDGESFDFEPHDRNCDWPMPPIKAWAPRPRTGLLDMLRGRKP
ncbi:MAG: hypothetical protein JWR07_1936 [Nevskia sp.]|nr:hypothetical protein [Nevskia sp.]